MPNNSSARRDKDKKKKDKKKKDNKKTDTLSLLKEDTASVDSSSLSLTGMREVPEIGNLERDVLRANYSWSLSLEERAEMKGQV